MRFLCQHKVVLVLLISLCLAAPLFVQSASANDEFPASLIFSKSDIPHILEKAEMPIFRDSWQRMINPENSRRSNFANDALIYALTGDKERGQSAVQGMLEQVEKEYWDLFLENGKYPIGFLSAAGTTTNMALAYDWAGDLLTEEQREKVLNAIAEKGCMPLYRTLYGMQYPETVKGWKLLPDTDYRTPVKDFSRWPVILGHNNFVAVLTGGLALGMYTQQDRDDRFKDWRDMVYASFDRFIGLIAEDGSYDEGVSYANYAMTHLIHAMHVIERKDGVNLFDKANFMGVMDFDLAMYMPTHLLPTGSVNFGDAGTSLGPEIGFWIAAQSRDGLAQYIAENMSGRSNLFSILYYDPTVTPLPPANDNQLYKSPFDWIVTRTGYELDDLVVAMRSGPPLNHEHADRNAVLLKYGGEVLLADTYRPTYDPTKPEWMLRTSAGHNTVRIGGKGQQYHDGSEGTNAGKSSAKLVRWGKRDGYTFWASDATEAYKYEVRDIASVTRTTLVFDKAPVIINIDKISKKFAPAWFTARWFAENRDNEADLQVNGAEFTISRPHAKFYGVCAGSPQMSASAERLPISESSGVYPYINIAAKEQAKQCLMIMAGSPLKSGEKQPEISITQDGDTWTVTAVKKRKKLVVNIIDNGVTPEFQIIKNDF